MAVESPTATLGQGWQSRRALPPVVGRQFLSVYGLAAAQTPFQILDRRSFHRFLDITAADPVRIKTRSASFGKRVRAQLCDALFTAFREYLESKGFITRKGQIADAPLLKGRASATAGRRTRPSNGERFPTDGRMIPNH